MILGGLALLFSDRLIRNDDCYRFTAGFDLLVMPSRSYNSPNCASVIYVFRS